MKISIRKVNTKLCSKETAKNWKNLKVYLCVLVHSRVRYANNAYKLEPSFSERVIVDGQACHTALHFGVKAKENQDKVPTLYWLPKLHKKPY